LGCFIRGDGAAGPWETLPFQADQVPHVTPRGVGWTCPQVAVTRQARGLRAGMAVRVGTATNQ
jgi:hypothetical protein